MKTVSRQRTPVCSVVFLEANILEIHYPNFSTKGLGTRKVQFLSGPVTHTCNLAFGRPRKRITGVEGGKRTCFFYCPEPEGPMGCSHSNEGRDLGAHRSFNAATDPADLLDCSVPLLNGQGQV